MAKETKKELVVTSKKKIETEKGDGTYEERYITTLSDGTTKVTISSVEENNLINGESIVLGLKQSQKTLLETKPTTTTK